MIQPRRLLDRRLLDKEAASELGAALREARAATGSAEQLARLRHKLGEGGGASAGTGGGAAELASLAATKSWTVLGALVLGALGVAAYVLGGEREAVPVQRARPAVVAPVVTRAADSTVVHQGGGVGATPSGPAEVIAAPAPASTPEPRATPAPAMRARRERAVSHRRNDSPVVAPAHAAVDPDAELALLTRAEQALELKPALTLAILGEHAQRFPEGVLAQEREILSIDAELALGRKVAASARARGFLLRFPSSPHRHRFESMLGAQPQVERDHKIDAPRIPTDATPARR